MAFSQEESSLFKEEQVLYTPKYNNQVYKVSIHYFSSTYWYNEDICFSVEISNENCLCLTSIFAHIRMRANSIDPGCLD